jgi:hypothetical protein
MKNPLWSAEKVNDKRVSIMRERTKHTDSWATGCLAIDDTLDEHVGSLFDYIAKHYDHCDGGYKLAQNPVTSHFVKGKVSFPVDFRCYRTYDESTDWAEHFLRNFPDIQIPKTSKKRKKLKKKYEKDLLEADAEFAKKHNEFKTKINFAVELINDAVERKLVFFVVLFDSWYLAPEIIEVIEKAKKAWISILKKDRNLETQSLKMHDEEGKRIEFENSKIKAKELIPLIPKSKYKAVKIDQDTTYYAFTFTANIPTLGKVLCLYFYSEHSNFGKGSIGNLL